MPPDELDPEGAGIGADDDDEEAGTWSDALADAMGGAAADDEAETVADDAGPGTVPTPPAGNVKGIRIRARTG